jgi:MYXO-CTERM domain-containing protein
VQRLDRRERLALAAIVAVALWLRLLYLMEQRHDLLFDYPVVDEERYVAMGRGLATGFEEQRAWFHPPGVAIALSLVFRVFGDGLVAPRVVQAVVSSASCLLAYGVARRLFGARVALGTATVCALHGVLVFESYEILPPTWVLASTLGALWLLLVARDRASPEIAVASGAAFGVSAVFAPTILPFAAVAAAWLRRPALAGALAVGVLLPIAPITYGNWERSGELVLISTNGGINLYLGNNEHAGETLAIRPGPHWEALMDEPARAGVTTASGASSYFTAKALAFVRAEPLTAARAYLHKLRLYAYGAELPRDTDLYAAREGSPLLSALVSKGPLWLPDGLLLPLAGVGAIASWRRRRELAVAYAYVAAQALVVAAFFVTSRYRAPALPVLAMFACAGVGVLVSAAREARGWKRFVPLAELAVLALLLGAPAPESRASYAGELDFYRGLAAQRHERDAARAVGYFERATVRDPSDSRFWFELGNAYDETRRYDDALDAWIRAAASDAADERPRPRIAGARMRKALLLERAGDAPGAVRELDVAVAVDPRYVRAQLEGFARAAMKDATTPDGPFLDALAGVAVTLDRRDVAALLKGSEVRVSTP